MAQSKAIYVHIIMRKGNHSVMIDRRDESMKHGHLNNYHKPTISSMNRLLSLDIIKHGDVVLYADGWSSIWTPRMQLIVMPGYVRSY